MLLLVQGILKTCFIFFLDKTGMVLCGTENAQLIFKNVRSSLLQ